jgi:hypothetical protein
MLKIMKLTLALFVVVFFSTCKKDCCQDPTNPKCENYDPCYGKKATSAFFIIEEKFSTLDKWIECDSVNGIGNISAVRFSALNDADSFIWTIGSETIYTKSFTRFDFPLKKHIPITLVVINKNPNKKCFPNDDGRDTFKRMMYTWGREIEWDQSKGAYVINNPKPIQGVYRGYYESDPKKEVTIVAKDTVYSCTKLQTQSRSGFTGFNLPEGFFQPNYDDNNCGYFGGGWTTHPIAARIYSRVYNISKYGEFSGDSIIQIIGFMQLSRDLKKVEIEFEYFPLWDEIEKKTLKKDKFKGIKIQ